MQAAPMAAEPTVGRGPKASAHERFSNACPRRPAPSVCVICHTATEGPGLIADALRARGVVWRTVRTFRGDPIPPRLGDHAGLVLLGGPMGVYEQERHPYLRQEIRLLEDTLSQGLPVLGICLGSQLLAAALGASVQPGWQRELGWQRVTLGQAAAQDALWRGLPESFTAFHWHGDVFDLPRAATPLAWSKLTEHQAFRYGANAYGLLFHLEMTEPIIRRMTRSFRRELAEARLSAGSVLAGVVEHLPALQTLGRVVFERWAALVAGGAVSPNHPVIQLKRVYEPAAASDGTRFLVDRLWPRGVKKSALALDGWLKEAAPSDGLRRWFHHAASRWAEFCRRYAAELDRRPEVMQPILDAARRGAVTLLFAAQDRQHNHAIVLQQRVAGQWVGAGQATGPAVSGRNAR